MSFRLGNPNININLDKKIQPNTSLNTNHAQNIRY
jgi:hypothetical protein